MFKAKTVDSVMAVFTATIADLKKVKEKQEAKVEVNDTKVQELLADSAVAREEAERAANIIDKLQDLCVL